MYAAPPQAVKNPPTDGGSGAHTEEHKDEEKYQCPPGQSHRAASDAGGLCDTKYYTGEDH